MNLPRVSIVTLTRFPEIWLELSRSIDLHESLDCRKIVVTSGQSQCGADFDEARSYIRCDWDSFTGIEPFVYARNANIGIRACSPDDVLLTNDDVRFTAPMLDTLRRISAANPDIGLISPQVIGDGINNVWAQASSRWVEPWIESAPYVPFVCVYLPRHAIHKVGLVDERFTGYGGDDRDWCLRCQRAGLKLAVTSLAKVHHGYGPDRYSSSFFRVLGRDERDRQCAESLDQTNSSV